MSTSPTATLHRRSTAMPTYVVAIVAADATTHLVVDHRAAAAAVFNRSMPTLCGELADPAPYARPLYGCAVCAETATDTGLETRTNDRVTSPRLGR